MAILLYYTVSVYLMVIRTICRNRPEQAIVPVLGFVTGVQDRLNPFGLSKVGPNGRLFYSLRRFEALAPDVQTRAVSRATDVNSNTTADRE
jgi:hypothetical protein